MSKIRCKICGKEAGKRYILKHKVTKEKIKRPCTIRKFGEHYLCQDHYNVVVSGEMTIDGKWKNED